MAFLAVLDACVLFPYSLRDLLLRLAEVELYDLCWSDRILEEVRRNLILRYGMTPAQADRLDGHLRAAFDGACANSQLIDRIEPTMPNQDSDRHVLAAAVASGAEVVVTANLKHFARCDEVGVTAMHPDEFLCDLLQLNPEAVDRVLGQQVADLRKPRVSRPELLDWLESKADVPEFATLARLL
jgi:hypothetical protein